MNKIRVMQLIASTSVAGAENVVKMLLDNIDRLRFEPQIANFVDLRVREPNPFAQLLANDGYVVDDVPIARVYDWRQVSRLVYLLKKNQIDLLHTHGYRSDFLGYIAARQAGVPIMATVHGTARFSGRLEIKARLRMKLWMQILKRFDRIVTVSEDLLGQLIRCGIPTGKIQMLRNAARPPDPKTNYSGADFRKEMGIRSTTKLIGTVGRLSHEKGHEYLIQALPSCLKNGADIKCIIVGDGPRREALEKLADELCPRGTVEFLGYRDDVQRIYPALDVFVLPSLIEGTPIALLEAMGSKLPVVVTAVGGIPEIIRDGFNGVLVQPGSSEGLALGIRKVLHCEALGREMAERNLDLLAREFDVAKWARSIESIYTSLVMRQDTALR